MMSAEQIITLALNPETRTKMEMDIFGRLARMVRGHPMGWCCTR